MQEENGLEGKVELEVCERKMGATQFSLDGTFTISIGNNNPTLVRLRLTKVKTSKEPQPQSQFLTVNKYIINLIKREKVDSFVGRMYYAEESELHFCCGLGQQDLSRVQKMPGRN